MSGRKLHFGAFLYTPGSHSAGWRHPDAVPSTDMHFPYYLEMARTAERGRLDTIFLQDTAAIGGSGGLDGAICRETLIRLWQFCGAEWTVRRVIAMSRDVPVEGCPDAPRTDARQSPPDLALRIR